MRENDFLMRVLKTNSSNKEHLELIKNILIQDLLSTYYVLSMIL